MGFSLRQALLVDMETFNKIEFLCPIKQHETQGCGVRHKPTTKSTYGPDVSTLLDVCEIFHAFANPHNYSVKHGEALEALLPYRLYARSTCTQSDGFFLLSFPTFFSPPPTVKTTVVYVHTMKWERQEISD